MTIIDRITAWLVKKEIIPPTDIPTTAHLKDPIPPEWAQKAADERQKQIDSYQYAGQDAYNQQALQAADADKAAEPASAVRQDNERAAYQEMFNVAIRQRDTTISKLRETIADGMAVQQSQAAEITSLKRALTQAKARNKTLARKAGAK